MRALLVLAALVVLAVVATPSYRGMFESFKKDYNRHYSSVAEESKRFAIFVENMKKAEKLTKANPNAVFGVNEFADVTAEEFKIRHSAEKHFAAQAKRPSTNVYKPTKEEERIAAGNKIDWRTKGAVTPIKNQGQCGSCWSFSSTGSIEGQWFLAGNTLTSVSEQELVSCDTVDSGCNGGLMDNAWGWLLSAHNGAIVTEASYPYVSGNGVVPACSMSGTKVGATINGHQDITKTESAMGAWVYSNGPLSVAVDATSWQTYVSGIMTNCISSQIDHGVLVVGFDDTNSPPYWIVKNSWGTSWGENGYIRVQKGTDQCLITYLPCSSTVAKGPNPPGPSPPGPSPPGPSPPAPANGTFTQKVCSDDKCQNCKSDTLPQGTCIPNGVTGSSFTAVCLNDGLLITTYNTNGCTGPSTQTVNPINICTIVFKADHAYEWILNDCSSGPSPPGPSPPSPSPPGPSPPGPSPPGPSGTFIQEQCQDAACSQGCVNYTFQTGVCLGLSGGGSAIAQCNSQGLLLTEYPTSSSCTGPSVPDQMPTNQCLQDTSGTYLENFCFSSQFQPPSKAAKIKRAKRF
jgi:C1A family cysteine protease